MKRLSLFDYNTKQNTIEKLKEIYLQYKENEISVNENSSNLSETSRSSSNFFESIFDNEEHDEISEVDKYLDLHLIPLAHQSENPWAWWETRKNEFPILSKISRKYLSIPATSVPAERLFSDASNQINPKRTCLAPKLVNELLFLKRNNPYCEIDFD